MALGAAFDLTALLVGQILTVVTPIELVLSELAIFGPASAKSVLRSPLLAVALGPGPTANATVIILATILIGDLIAVVAPVQIFDFKGL